MYEIRIENRFHAAHAIRLPDGSFELAHTHHWQVQVTVAAGRLDGIETVMDFHRLQALLEETLAPACDADLNTLPPFAAVGGAKPVNPTAERVAWWIGRALKARLPRGVKLARVAVEEAPGCWAYWRPM